MVLWVIEFAGFKLLNSVENTIKFTHRELHGVPVLVKRPLNRQFGSVSPVIELLSDCVEGIVHSEQLFVHLSVLLKSVRRVNQDSVGLIGVYLNVDVRSWDGLLLSVGAIRVGTGDAHLQVLLGVLILRNLSEHH